jgi:hypothetical protein
MAALDPPPCFIGGWRKTRFSRARRRGRTYAVAPARRLRIVRRGIRGFVLRVRRPSFFVMAWIVVGVVVAATKDYFDHLGTAGRVASAIVAVLLWPLLLLGFDISISR